MEFLPELEAEAKARQGTRTDIVEQIPPSSETGKARDKAVELADYAKRVKDWPLLEQAVDAKIEEQREFVAWWEKHVTPVHGAGRGNKNIPERRPFSLAELEKRTGISNQQVSRWRKARISLITT